MNDEIKQLIEDAAKLLELPGMFWDAKSGCMWDGEGLWFDPRDPERGDLMKVAMAAELDLDFECCEILYPTSYSIVYEPQKFTKGDHDSLALAILRAASAVYRAGGGE